MIQSIPFCETYTCCRTDANRVRYVSSSVGTQTSPFYAPNNSFTFLLLAVRPCAIAPPPLPLLPLLALLLRFLASFLFADRLIFDPLAEASPSPLLLRLLRLILVADVLDVAVEATLTFSVAPVLDVAVEDTLTVL